ncbi:PREDICTED: uncharacterized protein LOC108569536 [Nicrophorus vespilloides]|uniref:Uncharacterized protein LOC108569536 n=1 Tax=Nicrophorus vespilloides TaxID=110193 RepID=A0ABM1NIF9_NICVS|nr:PREDICTED: uncharacterized protein LOC108569536 [Nicrophorus vespilloides]
MRSFIILVSLSALVAAYDGPIHIPVIGSEGVPVEPLEVQEARTQHLLQRAAVAAERGYYHHQHLRTRREIFEESAENYVPPMNTPQVQMAREAYLAQAFSRYPKSFFTRDFMASPFLTPSAANDYKIVNHYQRNY